MNTKSIVWYFVRFFY